MPKSRFLLNELYNRNQYRGRFAPSPTGPLHFGSLVAAVGSYLDARHHQGKWLVRIEDLDTPRTVKGAADDILRTLEAYGLHWDEDVVFQSRRTAAYEEAFLQLKKTGEIYACACSRKEIADSALHYGNELIYPGTCRNGIEPGKLARSWRVRVNETPIGFIDRTQGEITQNLATGAGDFVVLRADGLFAYQLAVVVDDDAQRVTDVVRGADLLYSTPRQIYLQRLLGMDTPAYMHLPIAVNAQGEKLSKQTLAKPVEKDKAGATLFEVLMLLRQEPPAALRAAPAREILAWAIDNWQPDAFSKCCQFSVE
ncbi:MAG: Glutamyl-Q tRNA(Asp) synthetase [Candidatus Gallionella acididurans]|uniref:Glutamyl-Q tRNA(Asp) synthetase n=1 Tax=Candidatus Gallionella acididurans TaxID=1796491 RepID=A0A139BUM7_9PROT|nr:MAG: Glutamyl-Q tRNA(Asp) synthetase [Candidatus Gallionella acididurans]